MKRRAVLFGAGALGATAAAAALRPSRRSSQSLPAVRLDAQVPVAFENWAVDKSLIPVLPDPSLQSALDKIYAQVLARTYINGQGQRVMLSIAYGEDQGSDATAVHRPEFCYTAQGFSVRSLGEESIAVNGHALTLRRLIGSLGPRFEPISYWITLNDSAVLPGVGRKLEQIRLGLAGEVPDGMLVRVSTLGLQQQQSFAVQDTFLAAFERSLAPPMRSRYFGRGNA